MFKRPVFFALSAAFLLIISCQPDHSTTTCFPAQITSVTHVSGGQTKTSITNLEYDDKMNLVEIKDEDGSLTFTYTGGRITSALSTSGQTSETWSYNSNGLLSHVDGSKLPGSFFNYTYTQDFIYNTAGQLVTIEWSYSSGAGIEKQTFEYSNGNETYQFLRHDKNVAVADSIIFQGMTQKEI